MTLPDYPQPQVFAPGEPTYAEIDYWHAMHLADRARLKELLVYLKHYVWSMSEYHTEQVIKECTPPKEVG